MKSFIAGFVFLLAATVAVAGGDRRLKRIMVSYWGEYSASNLTEAAKYIAPTDLVSVRGAMLPLFLDASRSEVEDVRAVADAFFQGVEISGQPQISTVQAWIGMHQVLRAFTPKYAEGLPDTEIEITDVRFDSKIEATIHFDLSYAGSSVSTSERFSKIDGQWYLRIKNDPWEVADEFGKLFAQASDEETQVAPSDYELADIYVTLRTAVLEMRSAPDPAMSSPIAVLMEMGYPEAVATLVAVSDGSVSMYFSTGGGIIGAGEHKAVRRVAKSFLGLAKAYLGKAEDMDSYPLPTRGMVRFYFVTSDGVRGIEAAESDLGEGRHSYAKLFYKAQELVAAMREHTPP